MKKIISAILVFILAISLCGCGSNAKYAAYDSAEPAVSGSSYYAKEAAAPSDEAYYEEAYYDNEASTAEDSVDLEGTTLVEGQSAPDFAQKIIYTAYAEIETTDFDNALKYLESIVNQYNGFIETSQVSGQSYRSQYYNYASMRHAYYTIRVPKENFASVKASISSVGNILNMQLYSQNITEQYTDVNSRLTAYRTEEERLLAMLDKAEYVEDMINIEERLSDVRYNIESITSRLRNWDNQVNYSTITVDINEVEVLTETVEPGRTYGQEIVDGLKSSLIGLGNFFKSFARIFITILPDLIVIAIVVFVIILIIKNVRKNKKNKIKDDNKKIKPKKEKNFKKKKRNKKVEATTETTEEPDNTEYQENKE